MTYKKAVRRDDEMDGTIMEDSERGGERERERESLLY
jgi:hypothetical protein